MSSMAPEKERKDRLIQTRVPRDLESTLKKEARRQGLTVSQLIRNILGSAFDLVEDRHVGGVGRVAAEDATGGDDVDRRLPVEHRPDLHRGGVRAQQVAALHVEGVLLVARGVLQRDVERFEVIVIKLNVRPFGH